MDILNSEDWPMRAKEQGWNRCFLAVLYGEKWYYTSPPNSQYDSFIFCAEVF